MSLYRDKYWRTGLPGKRNFEVSDLVAGDIPVWDNTHQRWDRSSAGSVTPFRLTPQVIISTLATSAPSAASYGQAPQLAITSSATSTVASLDYFAANTSGSAIALRKSRSGTIDAHSIVSSGDAVGLLEFIGSDGAAWRAAAWIFGNVDGTPGSSDMPGRLSFWTTTDGAATPVERVRIRSNATTWFTGGGQTYATPPGSYFGVAAGDIAVINTQSVEGQTNQANFRYSNSANGVDIAFLKSRSGTLGTNTLVSSGDQLGAISFFGGDGTNWINAARIQCYVDASPGTNDMPGNLSFWTTPDGSNVAVKRYDINKDGTMNGYEPGGNRMFALGGSAHNTTEIDLAAQSASNYKFIGFYAAGMGTREAYIGCNGAGNYEIVGEVNSGTMTLSTRDSGSTPRPTISLGCSGTAPGVGFLGAAAQTQKTVTGSRGGNAALASLLSAFAAYGLIVDSTTA